MKKILTVFGTRPEAIKMAPLVQSLGQTSQFESKVLVTAQHRHMLDQVLELFEIKPDFDFNLMKSNQTLSNLTADILNQLQTLFKSYRPDLVLVHGDTTTSFATALACFYHQIPVGHVEAGLRTYNLSSPFPEELNRQVTTKLARFHFCPTQASQENLLKESVPLNQTFITGNTVIDALLFIKNKIKHNPELEEKIKKNIESILGLSPQDASPYVLITGHRRENFGEGFINICQAIKLSALKHPDVHFIYPVHLNPQVKTPVESVLSGIKNVKLINPQDYLNFVYLMDHCHFILTDSGGIQEEAPSLGKPVLVMRDNTERPEALAAGVVKLVGSKTESICQGIDELIENPRLMRGTSNPYGDGLASQKIVEILKRELYFSW